MVQAGIDIGSRTVKLVLTEHGKVIHSVKRETSCFPLKVCEEMVRGHTYDKITATGYGRHLFCDNFKAQAISEIKAFAIGAKALFPGCRTILDIGGQDTKAIALDDNGSIIKFEMNDKCAAGTGKFMEIMALVLGYKLDELSKKALGTKKAHKINSMCTVFAESEIVSMLAKGIERDQIALGIHRSIAARSVSMMYRAGISEQVVFAGGVALNHCLGKEIQKLLNTKIVVPEDPQIIGALGCALLKQSETK